MRLNNLYILLFFLISSCEGIIQGKGKIISASSQLPIDSVKIDWFGRVEYSDKNGNFSSSQFVGCVPSCPDLELILIKEGYQSKYVNLTKENKNGKLVFQLVPTNKNVSDFSNRSSKNFLFYLSVITAVLSLITLLVLALIEVKNKKLWFAFILFGTVSLFYNYLEERIEVSIFRPSLFVFLQHTFQPTWYKLNLPIGLIIFWIYYYYKTKQDK